MKVSIEIAQHEQGLADEELLIKAIRGATLAVKQARPKVAAQVTAANHEVGGDIQALDDLSVRMAAAYEARVQRMLIDIADVLSEPPAKGSGRS
jgi:hypothetical protein